MKQERLKKLDPKAYVGYLVGYDSTNIYKVWVPEKGRVISTRDVIFDETALFKGRLEPRAIQIDEIEALIEKIIVLAIEAKNEEILEEDDV